MISYKPLLIQLVKKDMTKTQLRKSIGMSTSTLAKIAKNEFISLEVIDHICQFLNCNIEDVIEHIHNNKDEKGGDN